jgi:hypothetical protein
MCQSTIHKPSKKLRQPHSRCLPYNSCNQEIGVENMSALPERQLLRPLIIASHMWGWVELSSSRIIIHPDFKVIHGFCPQCMCSTSSGSPHLGNASVSHSRCRCIIRPVAQKPVIVLLLQCCRAIGVAFMAAPKLSQSISCGVYGPKRVSSIGLQLLTCKYRAKLFACSTLSFYLRQRFATVPQKSFLVS